MKFAIVGDKRRLVTYLFIDVKGHLVVCGHDQQREKSLNKQGMREDHLSELKAACYYFKQTKDARKLCR